MKKTFKNYKQASGQVTMEWAVVLLLAALALSAAKGYLKGRLQDSWRKNAEGVSQDLYTSGHYWDYSIEKDTDVNVHVVSID